MNNFFYKVFCLFFVLLTYCQSVAPCHITTVKEAATNPCVLLYSEPTIFNKLNRYLCFCPEATIVDLQNKIVVPLACKNKNKFKDYLDHNVYSQGKDIIWSGINGQNRTDFYMYPYTAANEIPDDLLYQPKYSNPITPTFGPIGHEGFPPETLVQTPFGDRPIGSLRNGDSVISYDFSNEQWTKDLIIATSRSQDQFIEIFLEGHSICCACGTKFYLVDSKEWVKAKYLKLGQRLLCRRPESQVDFSLKPIKQKNNLSCSPTVFITLAKYHNL